MEERQDINTEQMILNAAEKVFLEKGYAASRTTEIAQLAGVNHAMIHYYFRTKENLFNKVFDQKIQLFVNSFIFVFEQNISFLDKIKLAIETHFDFISYNTKLPTFILGEIMTDTERREVFKKLFSSKVSAIFDFIEKEIQQEVEKSNIVEISARNLILNIVSLNVFSFVASQILFEDQGDVSKKEIKRFYEDRKKNNVKVILKSISI